MTGTTDNKTAAFGKAARHQSSSAGRRAAREILLLGIRPEIDIINGERLARVLAGPVDWAYLLTLAEYHGVTPLLAHHLAQDDFKDHIPGTYAERLSRIYQNNIYRNMLLSDELVKVLSAFRQCGIEVITLKGTLLAEQLYVDPNLRTTTDIDVLVPKEKIPEAAARLSEIGYIPSTTERAMRHPFHRVFYKQSPFSIMVELHWDLNDPKLVSASLTDIWHRAQQMQLQDISAWVLSPEDTLMYLAGDLLAQDGLHLKYLSDINAFLRKYQDNLDWDYIIRSSSVMGIKPVVYHSLKWAREFLDAPVPLPAIAAVRPGPCRRALIRFLYDHRSLLSPIRWRKLRMEINAIVRGLMMSHMGQSLANLARYRADGKRAQRIRTFVWILLVFGTALLLNAVKWLKR